MRCLQKAIKVFNRRMQQFGLHRWSQRCLQTRSNYQIGQTLVNHKWRILMKSAFKLFKQKIELQKQNQKDFQRELYY